MQAEEEERGGLGDAVGWQVAAEVAAGLAHLHAASVLHLDVKPGNVFADGAGGLRLGDFGLAVLKHLWVRPPNPKPSGCALHTLNARAGSLAALLAHARVMASCLGLVDALAAPLPHAAPRLGCVKGRRHILRGQADLPVGRPGCRTHSSSTP